MNQTRRYPHDEAAELLIFHRSQSPDRGGVRIACIQRSPGES
jgi:hypothetical protein